ncbi:DUF2752 domain-containing protein [Demequina oxidasica]|uniref:DUF2752 domain-containing protein n=1 Tax=Demequina oxidasica TaxID=676199 RepID=UPI000A06C360|nr:DUF2752 domain-containing protein [Demequina oxidasica]
MTPTVHARLTRAAPYWGPIAVGVAALCAATVVAAVDPHEAGHYPTCPSLFVTGFWCPGCGSLRALHNLAHGDVMGALGMNVLVVIAVPFLIWRWGSWLGETLGRPSQRRLAPPWAIWLLLAGIVAFTVGRNIPVLGPLLAP